MYGDNNNSRIYVILFIFIAFFFILFVRLTYIQIISSKELSQIARDQYKRIIKLPPGRGNIYDRHHRVLALTMPVYSVYADPSQIKDIEFTSKKLAKILNLSSKELKNKIRKGKYFVWVKRHISRREMFELENLDLSGIGTVKEKARFYPNTSLAAHVIGYTGIDTQGLAGIEYSFDRYLKGVRGYKYINRDGLGRELVHLNQKYVEPHKGYHLVLTIDEVVQYIIETALKKAVKRWNAKGGSIIIMDPFSGEILGLANYPTFDPNNFLDYSSQHRRNRAISDIFEPGSMFKIVTASAVLEENLVKKGEKIYCENGAYKIHSHILNDYHPYKFLTFPKIIINSSNIGTVKLAQRLGKHKLYDYIRLFGFGSPTGIALPGEAKGIIRKPKHWSKISIASIPIGQEVGVTALQMACAISTIANGGKLMRPLIVKRIEVKENVILKRFTSHIRRRVMSSNTATALKHILAKVVQEGTGRKAAIEGIKVAGKTGTAQKIGKDGTYSNSKYIASFIGFAPVNKPVISAVVIIDEPSPIHFGGTVAAPIFREIVSKILSYLQTHGTKVLTSNF